MIQANELRIGNYVHISFLQENGKFNPELVKVSPIEIRDADHFGNDWTGNPIPLTEEWLLKFHWQLVKGNDYFIDSYFVTHSLLAIWQPINHNCNFHHL